MSEEQLIRRAQQGDNSAFEQLLLAHQKKVYNLCLRMAANPDDALDLSQEAFDPGFSEVFERKNAAYLNYGVGLCKYTGAGGKSGASDASSEVVGRIRKLLNDHDVAWQMCELGKTDAGGGGTVAKYMAKRNIDTLDAGVPVLSMHAPFEVVSKYDCYMTYRAVKAIFEEN